MGAKQITFLFILIFSTTLFSQDKQVTISNIQGKKIAEFGIYTKNKKIGETNINGVATINHYNQNDTIFFVKNGYETPKYLFKNIPNTLLIDSLRTLDIQEVVITKYVLSPKEILDKINQRVREKGFYGTIQTQSQTRKFYTANKTFYSVENNFLNIKGKGMYIENRKNVFKNFKSVKEVVTDDKTKEIYTNIFSLNGEEFYQANILGPNNFVSMGVGIFQLKSLIDNFSSYKFTISKSGEMLILSFTPIKNDDFLYIGRLILDQADFGLYELNFNLTPSQNTMKSVKNLKYKIEKEKTIIRNSKINGNYNLLYYQYDFVYKGLNGKIKNEVFHQEDFIKPIDITLEKPILFNSYTLEFKE